MFFACFAKSYALQQELMSAAPSRTTSSTGNNESCRPDMQLPVLTAWRFGGVWPTASNILLALALSPQ